MMSQVTPRLRLRARLAMAALLGSVALAAGGQAGAAPSTFGTVVGSALLCLDEIDNKYFYAYLFKAFGKPYKHEGGAWWFKSDGNLWNAPINDVFVSDDTSPLVFVGAVADATAEKLTESVVAASGIHYGPKDFSAHPVRASNPGSKIIYFNRKSKIFCVKYKPLPPPPG